MRLVVPNDVDDRVDRFLSGALGVSRATVQHWLKEGRVTLDGKPRRPADRVQGGMLLDVEPGPAPASRAEPDPSITLDVVFEDAHLVVINKPPGLVVHPGKGNWTKTLINGLLARPGFSDPPVDPRDHQGSLRPGVVHRIDKDTSGLLVVAKDVETRESLSRQLAARTADRSYLAISVKVPRSGRVESFYGRHPTQRVKFTSRLSSGKLAVTDVEVLEPLPLGCALLRCRLQTGRTHQIRVHLNEQLQAPLLADALYGSTPQPLRDIANQLGRHALHAQELGFEHPITHERLHFTAELPTDMQTALQALRALADQSPDT